MKRKRLNKGYYHPSSLLSYHHHQRKTISPIYHSNRLINLLLNCCPFFVLSKLSKYQLIQPLPISNDLENPCLNNEEMTIEYDSNHMDYQINPSMQLKCSPCFCCKSIYYRLFGTNVYHIIRESQDHNVLNMDMNLNNNQSNWFNCRWFNKWYEVKNK